MEFTTIAMKKNMPPLRILSGAAFSALRFVKISQDPKGFFRDPMEANPWAKNHNSVQWKGLDLFPYIKESNRSFCGPNEIVFL